MHVYHRPDRPTNQWISFASVCLPRSCRTWSVGQCSFSYMHSFVCMRVGRSNVDCLWMHLPFIECWTSDHKPAHERSVSDLQSAHEEWFPFEAIVSSQLLYAYRFAWSVSSLHEIKLTVRGNRFAWQSKWELEFACSAYSVLTAGGQAPIGNDARKQRCNVPFIYESRREEISATVMPLLVATTKSLT